MKLWVNIAWICEDCDWLSYGLFA